MATQAVEVSLNLDYDCCFSELSPLESLVQRFGRCNRRKEPYNLADVEVFSVFPETDWAPYLPYDEAHISEVLKVLRTFVGRQPTREILESDVEMLIDRSYPQELQDALRKAINLRANEIAASLVDTFEPFGIADTENARRLGEEWESLFGSAQEFDSAPISCGFLKGYEFHLRGGQALGLQQQIV